MYINTSWQCIIIRAKTIQIAECVNKAKKKFVILQANAQSWRKKNTNGGMIVLQDHSTGTYANKMLQNAVANGTSINQTAL